MKIVLAIDSFKGCLTSQEAEEAAKEGILTVFPSAEIKQIPIADGGEGMIDILVTATNGKYITVTANNPLMEPIQTKYGSSGDGRTAFIEMAAASGLPSVSPAKRNPLVTTTYGTGELIKDALDRGYRDFVVGIGGSATNDAGLGMLQALGFRFFDKEHHLLGKGGKMMKEVVHIDTSHIHPALKEAKFMIACDVQNPFCGTDGAAYVYARQKGADDEMIKELDEGMQTLAETILQISGKNISSYPGAGAAGGMGGSFLAFLNAELKPGIRLLSEFLRLAEQIENADFIITGEGKADKQTGMGKVPYGILQEAQKQNIPVILIGGNIEDAELLNRSGFAGVFPILPAPVSLEKAMEPAFAKKNIRRTVQQICRIIHLFLPSG